MIHARSDYNRIQDPAVENPSLLAEGCTPIGVDEPVFLIRGKDRAAYTAIMTWATVAKQQGAKPEIVEAAREHAKRIQQWQQVNGGKVADAPDSVL